MAGAPGNGKLVGVGVGPGSPDLLTLRAMDVLRSADRVVAPVTSPGLPGRAEAVVRAALPEVAVHRVVFAMGGNPGTAQAEAARQLVSWLSAGETVAFVTLGDPNCYSTFSSTAAAVLRLDNSVSVTTVPGIMAFQELASRTGTVLLDGTERLALVTALDGPEKAIEALQDPSQAVVVYKGGRHLPEIASHLTRLGRDKGAITGELLGMQGEVVSTLGSEDMPPAGPAGYLLTIIVPPASRPMP